MSVYTEARAFIGKGLSNGKYICCCCGMNRAEITLKKGLKSTFTDMTALMKAEGDHICGSCIDLYNCKDMRFKAILSEEQNKYRTLERNEVLEILADPPGKFVLSVPYSFKKHHWLYAGISTPECAYVGTDDRTVILDYRKHNIPEIIETIRTMIAYGIPRSEIISGKYSIFTYEKFPVIEMWEKELQDIRPTGAVELFVKYSPAPKEKLIYEKKEENLMLSQSEINAVNFLASIAQNSQYRIDNGIGFWGGFFERRINRFKSYDVKNFAEHLSSTTASSCGLWCEMLKDMPDDELEKMMEEIRIKTHILVAIVYSERNKNK